MKTHVAKARSSQLVSTYGVGSIFPAVDDSVMICGLDDWPAPFEGERIDEVRLARALGVTHFQAPPRGRSKRGDVPVVRFPEQYFCPQCRRLARRRDFCRDDQNTCSGPGCGVSIVPSRFVAACARGHIQDFPYFAWVHRGHETAEGREHRMTLEARGRSSALGDLVVHCACGVPPRSLSGIFGTGALRGIASCRRTRPWLSEPDPDACDQSLRTLQRGSSNVWFPVVRSALSIPPWTETAARIVARHATQLDGMSPEMREPWIGAFANALVSRDALVSAVRARYGDSTSGPTTDEDMRVEEYAALCEGKPEGDPSQQFVCVPRAHDVTGMPSTVGAVSEVSRLREVRALQGFSRLSPWSPGDTTENLAPLSLTRLSWLPALETLGEGVFLRLDTAAVRDWEETHFARSRAEIVENSRAAVDQGIGTQLEVTPRALLLHTFAHVLLQELSLGAGYPAASLRERVYDRGDQVGVLIYTASGDSAGSLGGLAAQSDPERLASVVSSLLARARWCSNDPVCIESSASGISGLNIAACHSCVLLPETSCERYNLLLDRACLVGTPDAPAQGFFGDD